jgi:hypothetical protein
MAMHTLITSHAVKRCLLSKALRPTSISKLVVCAKSSKMAMIRPVCCTPPDMMAYTWKGRLTGKTEAKPMMIAKA